MAHEIGEHDKPVFHKTPAWHGLGIVVEEAPTPLEALTLAGLDWEVDQHPVYVKIGDEFVLVRDHLGNFRRDIRKKMSITSDSYKPVQNKEMAEFCAALQEDHEVHCESAGSIRNGEKVWFLLKGRDFEIGSGDKVWPYVLVSNGHDGGTSFRVTPTTVRVVCSNMLHMVIPSQDRGQLRSSAIVIRHTDSVTDRVAEARRALKHYLQAVDKNKKLYEHLQTKKVTRENCQEFFLECYTRDFNAIPESPTNDKERKTREKAMDAYNLFARRFDSERDIAGDSWWNAFNAYSGLVQHDFKMRAKNAQVRAERRMDANLFGVGQERSQKALQLAVRMAS